MRRLASAVAIALLGVAGSAHAEAAPGSTLNPSGGDTTRITDERGLSHWLSIRRRSPAGFLFPDPLVPNRLVDLAGGWRYRGSLEFGGLWTLGDGDETRFNEFTDWSEGPFLEFFNLTLAHPESGFYADVNGGSAGRDDQYYYAKVGVPGLVRLEGSFSGIPHVFARDATNLYEGAGSGVLRLPEPLERATSIEPFDDIVAAIKVTDESRLELQRDRTQFSLAFQPLDSLNLFARYSFDDRDGERPFGGSLIFDFGGGSERVVETTEPRDYRTHNFTAGVWFRSSLLLANIEYHGSLFRNRNSTLTWDNPFLLLSINGAENVKLGRFALAPDNHWHNFKGDISITLPWNGRLTTTASWSQARQDDDLIPPTVNSEMVGVVDLNEWKTAAALPRSSADARVDTLLVNARLHLRPLPTLRLRAGIRYYDQQNDTRYTAHNPSTGQFGYIAEDGALNVFGSSRVFVPGVGTDDFRYRSSPFDYRKLDYEISADYQLLGRTTLSGRYKREEIDRDERERDKTRENQARVRLTSRDLRWATLRASYEYRDREGGAYDFFPNRDDYVSSLPGYIPIGGTLPEPFTGQTPPFTLAQLRKYDIADREHHEAKLSANFLPRDDLDLSISTRFVDQNYGASYGLKVERWGNVDFELDFQPSPVAQAYVFGHFEMRHRQLANINDVFVFPTPSDPNAGPDGVFPFENAWKLDTNEVSWGVGTGIRIHVASRVILDVNYVFIHTEEEYDFDIAGPGALSTGLTEAQDLPDLRTRNHSLQTSIRFSIIENASLRIFYRFERSTIRDFSQRGLVSEEILVSSGALFLGHIDRNYDVHVLGLTLQIRL